MKSGSITLHDPTYRRLIKNLVTLRREASITQTSMAEAIGLEQPDVSKIEHFERRMDALELFRWLKAACPDRHTIVYDALMGEGVADGQ